MQKLCALLILVVSISTTTLAQIPGMQGGGGRGGMNSEQMNVGRFYGKIIDKSTGKPIEYATVQLNGQKWDSTAKAMKPVVLGGQITSSNGDFSIEKLPPFGDFTLKINAMGYKSIDQKVKFDLKFELGKPMDMQKAMNAVDKDLGNITLEISNTLKEVVIEGGDPTFRLEIDKKVFDVGQNTVTAGGTAEDVLKTVPSVSVDMDGNVALRNARPTIFVDGRPTSMTLEQIPADAIQSIELITNPSAKYDASGGMGGIINIVLKKNRKLGYNGGIRAGIDKFGKINGGMDINVREGKINFFGMLFANQRRSVTTGFTDRQNFINSPLTNVYQSNNAVSDGNFLFGRFGFDWFLDNRNTLTLGYNVGGGKFNNDEDVLIRTDSVETNGFSSGDRTSITDRSFNFTGSNISYKHLFPKAGMELTSDVNFNTSKSEFTGDFNTQYFNASGDAYTPLLKQQQAGNGKNNFLTLQTDYVNPINDKSKIETGVRAAFKDYTSLNKNSIQNPSTGEYIEQASLSNNYEFKDVVYAAYATYSRKINRFSFQTGLRVESSSYSGSLILKDSTVNYANSFPVSLFPSFFTTYKVNDKDDLQFSYSRKVNRPNFFQLIPFVDYTDSLNLSRGNPGLLPEFTDSYELSYLKTFNSKNNALFSAYYKSTSGLITKYQFNEYNDVLKRDAIMSSYINANSSYSYGAELTFKNELKKWLDVTSNLNIYNAVIDGSNIEKNLTIQRWAWFGKLNANFKLPKNFTVQLTGEYKSKTAVAPGGGGGRGGGFFSSGVASSAQGFIRETYSVDISVKKDLFKNKMGSISLAVRDIFRTDVNYNHSESVYFTQDTFRRRNPQYIRLNFSYRFGKFDVSVFKRKNMNNLDGGGMEMQGM